MGRRPIPFGLTPEQEYEYLRREITRYRTLNLVITCAGIFTLIFMIVIIITR